VDPQRWALVPGDLAEDWPEVRRLLHERLRWDFEAARYFDRQGSLAVLARMPKLPLILRWRGKLLQVDVQDLGNEQRELVASVEGDSVVVARWNNRERYYALDWSARRAYREAHLDSEKLSEQLGLPMRAK
jgi:hypothetical protein